MNSRSRSQIKWGIIIIGLGILFLLNTMGIITKFNWRLLLHFWPVIIIVIGLNIILKNTPLWWITPILFVSGIIVLSFIGNEQGYYQYDYGFSSVFIDREMDTYRSEVEMNEDIEKLDIDLNFSAGRLVLDSVKDENNLYEARLKYRYESPQFDYSYLEDKKSAYLSIKQERKRDNWFNFSGRNDWRLYLSREIPLIVNINAGAGEFNFNMEELIVHKLMVNGGAGDLEIDLGRNAQYLVLNSAAANVDLNIPDDIALSIKTDGLISSNNFSDLGLTKINNSLYQTPDYQSAINKLNIEINSPASNIHLDFYRMD